MKPNIRLVPAALCLFALCGLVIASATFFTGCATANRATYQALGTSRLTVQEGLGLYNVWVGEQTAKGIDTKPAEAKVKAAFEKWKASQLIVLEAARLNSVAGATNADGSTGLAAVLQDAIANSGQYKTDLFNLLTQIGVKLPL